MNRKDLFDEVVRRDPKFVIKFINQVKDATSGTLAALFLKHPDKADQVLMKIQYNDEVLKNLTVYRPTLAESHEGFFKVLKEIGYHENRRYTIEHGVMNLFLRKKHNSAVRLINALESSTFGRDVKDEAIQRAFFEGAVRGIKHFVEELHENRAITPETYARGLIEAWNKKYKVFWFLLERVDQSDLDMVKKRYPKSYESDQGFRKAIDEAEIAFSKSLKVPRHSRSSLRAELVNKTLDGFMKTGAWLQAPSKIVAAYLFSNQEMPLLVGYVTQMNAAPSSNTKVPPIPQALPLSSLPPKPMVKQETGTRGGNLKSKERSKKSGK